MYSAKSALSDHSRKTLAAAAGAAALLAAMLGCRAAPPQQACTEPGGEGASRFCFFQRCHARHTPELGPTLSPFLPVPTVDVLAFSPLIVPQREILAAPQAANEGELRGPAPMARPLPPSDTSASAPASRQVVPAKSEYEPPQSAATKSVLRIRPDSIREVDESRLDRSPP